ncbi:4-coumarate-CoA ligase 2, partial [Trifolium medium]|nr:4-coumarate-CoA ligase 2 [Trifolium medium]
NCLHFSVISEANEDQLPEVEFDPEDAVALPFSSGTTGLPKGKHKVTVAMVVPPLVLALVKNPMVAEFDLSSIRLVRSGAAPLGKELEEMLHNRIPQAVLGQFTATNPYAVYSNNFIREMLFVKLL